MRRAAAVLLTLLALAVSVTPGEARKLSIDDDPAKGSDDAPLTLVEFGDLQCPACLQWFRETARALEAAYIDTGKVRLVYLDLPLEQIHPRAFEAAVAAQCAGRQGKFWDYHDQIFRYLRYTRDDFVQYALAIDLDRDAFTACLDDPEVAEGIREDVQQARSLGVQGTPTFLLVRSKDGGGKLKVLERIEGPQPFEAFQAKIDRHLGGD